MLEYYNDSEKTNEVKKVDENGIEWFYTDTYAHMDSKGWLYIDGRDRRFFITYDQDGSPYKVYCDYVQSILKECTEVFDCAVVKKPDDVRSFIPKAYIVLKENIKYTKELEEKIKLVCGRTLQSCAIPEEYEIIENLPLTVAEKVDYTTLEKKCIDEYNDSKGKNFVKRNGLRI
jgi:acetyl-CoA synthetase